MQTEALKKMVADIQLHKSETQTIELKSASKGCPARLFDTLSSFSNQDGGGIIVFGIDGQADYSICGVYDHSCRTYDIFQISADLLSTALHNGSCLARNRNRGYRGRRRTVY